jgi:hypothetical protein
MLLMILMDKTDGQDFPILQTVEVTFIEPIDGGESGEDSVNFDRAADG